VTTTTAPSLPDVSTLYGQHVRLRPATSTAKPATRLAAGDEFGFLADLGNDGEIVAVHARKKPNEVRLFRREDYLIEPYPYLRIHVFHYPYRDPFWTWCREVGGDVYDYVGDLPRCGGRAEAWQAASEWLAAAEAKIREVAQ